MNITDFLLARIAEDEADVSDPAAALHFAPARVLAECEAKRRIVEIHQPHPTPQHMDHGTIIACQECGNVDDSPVEWPCPTILALDLPYADHPDYDDEAWRDTLRDGPLAT